MMSDYAALLRKMADDDFDPRAGTFEMKPALARRIAEGIDRLTAERDEARKDLADLKARLTEIADENIEIDLDYVSVGDDAADAWATAWGAAGKELREALGIETEVDHD